MPRSAAAVSRSIRGRDALDGRHDDIGIRPVRRVPAARAAGSASHRGSRGRRGPHEIRTGAITSPSPATRAVGTVMSGMRGPSRVVYSWRWNTSSALAANSGGPQNHGDARPLGEILGRALRREHLGNPGRKQQAPTGKVSVWVEDGAEPTRRRRSVVPGEPGRPRVEHRRQQDEAAGEVAMIQRELGRERAGPAMPDHDRLVDAEPSEAVEG